MKLLKYSMENQEGNEMNIEVETDKRVNIYALWQGRQIILCKAKEKYSEIDGEKWICLWPSKSDETKMIKNDPPTEPTQFLLSAEGRNYLNQIYRQDKTNNFIAKVEYVPINGRKKELWEELEKIGEFVLWDKEKGPMKYFQGKGNQYIAIYQVFALKYSIREEDTVPDKHGKLRTHYKILNETASKDILDNLKNIRPILSPEDFEKRKNSILEIIKKYPSEIYIRKYEHKYLNHNFKERNLNQEASETKYCIYCGIKLISEANYCYKCGKKQHMGSDK